MDDEWYCGVLVNESVNVDGPAVVIQDQSHSGWGRTRKKVKFAAVIVVLVDGRTVNTAAVKETGASLRCVKNGRLYSRWHF